MAHLDLTPNDNEDSNSQGVKEVERVEKITYVLNHQIQSIHLQRTGADKHFDRPQSCIYRGPVKRTGSTGCSKRKRKWQNSPSKTRHMCSKAKEVTVNRTQSQEGLQGRECSCAKLVLCAGLGWRQEGVQCAAPYLWNQLPIELREPHQILSPSRSPPIIHSSSSSLSPLSSSLIRSFFHSELQTWLFGKSFPP